MRLKYIGPDPGRVGVVPLPESWPARDHDEPNDAVAEAKCKSGMYAQASRRRRAKDDDAPEPRSSMNAEASNDSTPEPRSLVNAKDAPDNENAPDEARKEVP